MDIQKTATSAIIIGAGPAGAGTSFFLSKYQVPHIVIEKSTFPRDKVCGDACSGKTALVINRANAAWLSEILDHPLDFMPSWGITFVAPNGKALDIPFSPNRTTETRAPGFTVPRYDLDNFLFQKMPSPYCTILQDALITGIDAQKDKVTVSVACQGKQMELTAPVIIGADGDKSMVRKKLLHENTGPKTYAVGLRAYYEGISGLHPENFIELHFLPEMLPGYLWIFPLPGGKANVGVGILSERIREKNKPAGTDAVCHKAQPADSAPVCKCTASRKDTGMGAATRHGPPAIVRRQFYAYRRCRLPCGPV
jgi:flavin-dependent dehydrogenase